ncbi:acyl-CoA dehydrogenase [Mesorhizobium sp. L-8-10]|uniref:isovaleryl-CoA dehydrogenase n=1 Tax=unclassified Mesorhizobium TaxID=325217 RepID=UPI001927C4F2|nr:MULTISPECIES: isovaleryl-CoA dehydrogenase [unclassified Mesorhizobium]BCH23775.1 acyl-CoA dehydrogenase [Mesorhizobium sp. L-8-3]BCH31503.1 acyl-CoA dehydrogenase [Mesorhizobium sp. L-8-10]
MPDATLVGAPALDRYGAVTHDVINQPFELADYNLFSADVPLKEAVIREGAGWAANDLADFGARIGSAEYLELGALANRHLPEFDTHDRYGRRVDLVRFHPAYHRLMTTSIEEGLHSSPWEEPRPGAHVARAARFFMHSQVEAGHGCPVTMTFAAVPCLRRQPELARDWLPKMLARIYDPRNVPVEQKQGVTIGMAMTEKQGGSDVRANTTRAIPVGAGGPGQAYELVGHKFFVSAPMCDAFLVLAQTEGGLSCFLVPRWRPDGTKNPLQVLRLKKKMGNASNASSETELRGALGWMVGEEGRGVATIIEMVAMTRFDCMVGSSAGMRMATSQAIDHCSQRHAFGKRLIDQPMMRNVLADLALETEAAIALTMRIARALDEPSDAHETQLTRLGTAIGKYWICKRNPALAYEAMECIGGSGVMEDSPMPRLFRESPVNAIWEGSGNVQCLDVLRAMRRTPETVDAYFAEVDLARGGSKILDRHIGSLRTDLRVTDDFEERGRDLVDRLATGLQASLLLRHAPTTVAEAFCASRLDSHGAHQYGALPKGTDFEAIIERSRPR